MAGTTVAKATGSGSSTSRGPVRVVIDGIIGAGKSTLLRGLAERCGYQVCLEPVQEWEPLLQLMYEDPARWTMAFNITALLSFGKQQHPHGVPPGAVVLQERSPLACRHVFCDLGHRLGHMNDVEMQVVDGVFDLVQQSLPPVDVVIYMRTTPEVAFQRMRHRARPSEANVPLEYIRQLHDAYEHMAYRVLPERYPDIRVLTVDADAEPAFGLCEDMIKRILHREDPPIGQNAADATQQ